MSHPNEALILQFFAAINAHNVDAIMDCYKDDDPNKTEAANNALFQDIAFTLSGQSQIRAMWQMICWPNKAEVPSDISVTVKVVSANDQRGHAIVIDDYLFRETARRVQNNIISTFEFRNGRIWKQYDKCDPVAWASMAFGGLKGFMLGRITPLRQAGAMGKLRSRFPLAFKTT